MKKSEWLSGLGILGACALCCALPLIGGAAFFLGVSSFFLNPMFIVIFALVLVIAVIVFYQRRKANGSSCLKTGTGCSCNSCASGRG